LEQLAFNAQKIKGSPDLGHAPFWKKFKGTFQDCSWKHACEIWSPYI